MLLANTISVRNLFHSVIKIRSMKTLGSRIAHYREKAGLSQAALAKACGWKSQSRIGNYEKDAREPNLDDIAKIAQVDHFFKQNDLHGGLLRPCAGRCRAAEPENAHA